MHYIGMLAYRLPIPVYYHVPTVALSLGAALFSSLVTLSVVSRRRLSAPGTVLGSVLMGAGILTMHYTGMAAMRMAAMHRYHAGWFAVSVALGVGVSYAALWIVARLNWEGGQTRLKLIASALMGLAIASVHYAGMAAVSYMPTVGGGRGPAGGSNISLVANFAIVLVTFIVLGSASLTSVFDRALDRQAQEIFGLQARLMKEHDTVVREAARVRLLLDSTTEGIVGIDPAGNCTFCNRAACQQLGYSDATELIGRHLHSTIHHHKADGSVYPAAQCPLAATFHGNQVEHVDNELFWRADGSSFDVDCWKRPILRGDFVLGAVVTFWDITQRKQAEEAQNRSEQLFRSIAENTADMIAVVDAHGNRLYNNPAYHRILGFTPEELKQTISFEQIHPDDRELVMHAADESLRTGVGQIVEYRMQRKDGSYVSLESHGSFIRNSRGEIENLVISARDIGPRKLAAQVEKLGAIGQLAAGIAHEINTPAQFVSDNLCFLQDSWTQVETVLKNCASRGHATAAADAPDGKPAETSDDWTWLEVEVPKAITQSLEGMRRVSKIVGAMRTFSHSSQGEKQMVDINAALDATLTVANNELKHTAEVHREFQEDLPRVYCIPDEMNQVFLNLIINAIHAIRDACKNKLRAAGKISVRTRLVENDVQVEIEDNGTGIPEHVRSRIFEPFFTTKQVGEGTGQGLTICHDIVTQKHGGKIWFESEAGKGTTFLLRIPVGPNPKTGGEK
jgi:PAS domain S-box-containing protein